MKYIDLFAGCGGLSLGLERAGFKSVLAVEKSAMAAETYYHNFIKQLSDKKEWDDYCSLELKAQYKKGLIVNELRALLDSKELITDLKKQEIDLIAGGPPCQGFSLAGRRNPEDVRNQLPWQFLELVEMIAPKAVIIENVLGIKQDFNKHGVSSPIEELKKALELTKPGYIVQPLEVNAMHFGVPQHRPRVMLIAIRQDLAKLVNIVHYDEFWKSEYDFKPSSSFKIRPTLAPIATYRTPKTVGDAIGDIKAKIESIPNHTPRNHASHIQDRFRLYQYLQQNSIPSKILNTAARNDIPHEEIYSELSKNLSNVKFPASSPDGKVIAKSLKNLIEMMILLKTKKHSQRPIKWDAPSPTVLSLPDDFVHPHEPRTMTVREMARFQSFPDSFEFRAKETTGSLRRRFEVPQYTQVGNAVPPLLAEAVGNQLHSILLECAGKTERKKYKTAFA